MTASRARFGYAAAGALALLGLGLRVVPAAIPSVAVEPREPYALPERPSGDEQAATLLSFHDIVNANLLAPDRAAPEERYTPPELAAADSAAPVVQDTRPPTGPRWRLFGTAVGPEGSVALIDADPAIPGAEVYRVGDRIGAARVVEIRETAVILEGPSGRSTLSLPTSMRRVP